MKIEEMEVIREAEEAAALCIDCGTPLGPVGRAWSSCYLCDSCRAHRYRSERVAAARVRAWKEKHAHDPL